jgi:hypothetical protein
MKSLVRMTMAVALLIPVGAIAASPAGAAGGTTCKGASGKISLKPGLTTTPTVQTITINLPLTGCTGSVKSAVFKGSLKTDKISISSIATATKPLKLTSTITWNTKATSSLVANSTTKIVKGVINSSVTGKISKGLFAGSTFSSAQTVTLGPLVGGKIVSLNIKAKGAVTIK